MYECAYVSVFVLSGLVWTCVVNALISAYQYVHVRVLLHAFKHTYMAGIMHIFVYVYSRVNMYVCVCVHACAMCLCNTE